MLWPSRLLALLAVRHRCAAPEGLYSRAFSRFVTSSTVEYATRPTGRLPGLVSHQQEGQPFSAAYRTDKGPFWPGSVLLLPLPSVTSIGFSRDGTLKATVWRLVDTSEAGRTHRELQRRLGERGTYCLDEGGRIRMVTHYGIERSHVEEAVEHVRSLVAAGA